MATLIWVGAEAANGAYCYSTGSSRLRPSAPGTPMPCHPPHTAPHVLQSLMQLWTNSGTPIQFTQRETVFSQLQAEQAAARAVERPAKRRSRANGDTRAAGDHQSESIAHTRLRWLLWTIHSTCSCSIDCTEQYTLYLSRNTHFLGLVS